MSLVMNGTGGRQVSGESHSELDGLRTGFHPRYSILFYICAFIVTMSALSIGCSVLYIGQILLLIPLFGGICLMPVGAILMLIYEEKISGSSC